MKKKTANQAKTQQQRFVMVPTQTPMLRFSPTAWAKLLFLRDYGNTEVGGFGISPPEDLLYIEDVQLVKQVCSWAHVAFNDDAVADFFDAQVDAGRQPEQFARHWLHTHPGNSPLPSQIDEETFDRVFGRTEWSVMFILAREGQTYARLRFNVGPGAGIEIPVEVDYCGEFPGCQFEAWEQEYIANVQPEALAQPTAFASRNVLGVPFADGPDSAWYDEWFDYVDDVNEPLGKGP